MLPLPACGLYSRSSGLPNLHGVISEASTQCHVSTTPEGTFTSLGRCLCRASRVLIVYMSFKMSIRSDRLLTFFWFNLTLWHNH